MEGNSLLASDPGKLTVIGAQDGHMLMKLAEAAGSLAEARALFQMRLPMLLGKLELKSVRRLQLRKFW